MSNKIYNEVVWQWNELTGKMEEVFADYEWYDGDMAYVQGFNPGDSGLAGYGAAGCSDAHGGLG